MEILKDNLFATIEFILKANPNCLLSGSAALNLQGIKTAREPKDIDIFRPYSEKFVLIEGMKRVYFPMTKEDYYNEFYERAEYTYGGYCIDVFQPLEKEFGDLIQAQSHGIKCVVPHQIIGLKTHHALADCESRHKHRADIKFILDNN